MPKLRNKRDICLYVMKTVPFMFDTFAPTIKRQLRITRNIKRNRSVFYYMRLKADMLSSDY